MVVKVLCLLLVCVLSVHIEYEHMDLDYVTNEASRLTSYDRETMLKEIVSTK